MGTDAGVLVTQATGVALEAHGLSKRFGKKIALDAVDISVPAGSVTALVGPNGAGKTTLIRICMAFERPNRRQRQGGRRRPVASPQRGAPARRLRAADPGGLSRLERRRSPGDGPEPPLRLRFRLRAAAIEPARHTARPAGRHPVRRAGGPAGPGHRAGDAGEGPPARRAVGQSGPAGATGIHPGPDRRDAVGRLDGVALVPHRHRRGGGLRPAGHTRKRKDPAGLPARGSATRAQANRLQFTAAGRHRDRLVRRQGRSPA